MKITMTNEVKRVILYVLEKIKYKSDLTPQESLKEKRIRREALKRLEEESKDIAESFKRKRQRYFDFQDGKKIKLFRNDLTGCNITLGDNLKNVLGVLKQNKLLVDFRFESEVVEMGDLSAEVYYKIVLPENFDERFRKFKEELAQKKEEITYSQGVKKPFTFVNEKGVGYFKFYKEGENIEIGKENSRHFRLIQCLCEPHFGIQKIIDAIFEAIRLPKDKNDNDLLDYSPQRKTKILTLIEYAKKELQKKKRLQGKIKYKLDDRKNNMWLELED